jgi:hypothetical protein
MRERKKADGKRDEGGACPPNHIFYPVRPGSSRVLAALLVAGILIIPMIWLLPTACAGTDALALRLEKGYTEALNGGDYVGFNSSGKAWFGVVYGTASNPGPIRVVSLTTRYLGVAEVYDGRGRLLGSNVAAPVGSVAAQYLTAIYEFNDANGNGLFDYRFLGDPLNIRDISYSEPVFKSASLDAAWNLWGLALNGQGGYDFSLSAEDLPYSVIGNGSSAGKLDNITFTFHVSTNVKTTTVKIPVIRVTVERGGYIDSVQKGVKEYRAQKLAADFKTDHELTGWDFDPADQVKGRSLLLVSHVLVGAYIPPKVAAWIGEQFVWGLDGSGAVEYSDSNGSARNVSYNKPDISLAKVAMRDGGISLRDGWQKYGALSWISDVDVYPDANSTRPVKDTAAFQITWAGKFTLLGWRGAGSGALKALLLSGGFVYPGGYRVVHDPTFSAVAQLVDWGEFLAQLIPRGIAGLQMLVAVVGCVAAGALAISRRGRRRP